MEKNKEGYPDPTAGYAINGVCWEEIQRMREKQHDLKRGEVLALKFTVQEEEEGRRKNRTRRMKVVELYKHHVLLESPTGIRECMDYWKLEKCINRSRGGSNGA